MTPREYWSLITDTHQQRWIDNKCRRTPLTIMADREVLNLIVTGQKQSNYLTFDKCVLHTAYGDIYFHCHVGLDGEMVML
jgi:hypothetical protein